MKFQKEITLAPSASWATPPVDCAIFPGACRKADGTLALLLVAGSDFESADQRVMAYTGSRDGLSWTLEGNWGELREDGCLFNVCAKPTLLSDGRLLSLGYGYVREKPELSISGYAEKFGRFPTVKNFVSFSDDGGHSYSRPAILKLPRAGIEFSGPAVLMSDGRLLAFGPPFHVNDNDQLGLCYESTDQGVTWKEKSIYHMGGAVTSWESRGISLGGGRVAVIFWAFDCKKQEHLTNRIAYSEDYGATWRISDTGLTGQAANVISLENNAVGIIYAQRSGDNPGIYLSRGTFDRCGDFSAENPELLYSAIQGANAAGDILNQFYHLKFGQPSMLRLDNGSYLLIFWRKSDKRYEVVIRTYSR